MASPLIVFLMAKRRRLRINNIIVGPVPATYKVHRPAEQSTIVGFVPCQGQQCPTDKAPKAAVNEQQRLVQKFNFTLSAGLPVW